MDFIREIVSMKKNRYILDNFNLDLTYITPRIIAMAFPSDGLESIYRNNISDVARLLNLKHDNRYLIINASNRKYNYKKFNNRVFTINWPNHYPFPLINFIEYIDDIIKYLNENINNIIVVHCLAGKGRTGSLVNAILYLSGLFKNITDANEFYLKQRAVHVTFPSQLRYLNYFQLFVENSVSCLDFKPKILTSIKIETDNHPFLINNHLEISIYNFSKGEKNLIGDISYTNEDIKICKNFDKNKNTKNFYSINENINFHIPVEAIDLVIILKSRGIIADTKLIRFNINIFAITEVLYIICINEFDKPDNSIPNDLRLLLKFEYIENKFIENFNQSQCKKLKNIFKSLKLYKSITNFGNDLLFGNKTKINIYQE